jgi:hypothetical protein
MLIPRAGVQFHLRIPCPTCRKREWISSCLWVAACAREFRDAPHWIRSENRLCSQLHVWQQRVRNVDSTAYMYMVSWPRNRIRINIEPPWKTEIKHDFVFILVVFLLICLRGTVLHVDTLGSQLVTAASLVNESVHKRCNFMKPSSVRMQVCLAAGPVLCAGFS